MPWYRFWKSVQQCTIEDYFWIDSKDTKYIKQKCETWAEAKPGGHNTGYSAGFKKVRTPPLEWLESELKRLLRERRMLDTKISHVRSERLKKEDELKKRRDERAR